MTTTEGFDWNTITQAFTLGAFPWITQFKKLEIHLTLPGMKTRTVNNFFASLFAMSLFTVVTYSHPFQVIHFPSWKIFIGSAFILSIVFVAFYIYFKDMRAARFYKLAVMGQFVIYIFLFCSLTMGFGELKIFANYYVFKGQVVNANINEGLKCEVVIMDNDSTVMSLITDDDGRFNLLINNRNFPEGLGIDLEHCDKLVAYSEQYKEVRTSLYRNLSAISLIERIEMKQPK